MPRCVEVLIIGAGNRGQTYAFFSKDFPERMKVVGVADCRLIARQNLQMKYSVQDCNVFNDWKDAAELDKFADAVIIATPDRHHKGPAVAFAKKGYHILLEKPMAVTVDDCQEIVAVCKKNNVILSVCHVLRYSPPILKVQFKEQSDYRREINHLVAWCTENNRSLNVGKTKKLIIDFRKHSTTHTPVCINGSEVEMNEMKITYCHK